MIKKGLVVVVIYHDCQRNPPLVVTFPKNDIPDAMCYYKLG